jgi:hypothetical protein
MAVPSHVRVWLREHATASAIAALLVVVAALIQIIDGLPDLFDTALPWLGTKMNLGPVVANVWQILWVIPLIVALGFMAAIWRNTRDRSVGPAMPSSDGVTTPGTDGAGLGAPTDVSTSTGGGAAAPVTDRGLVRSLMHEARVRLEAERDLTQQSPEAKGRSAALRLWGDDWQIRMEAALAGDPLSRAAFARPVDTSQMHFVESPAHVIRTRLQRLTSYLTPGEGTAEREHMATRSISRQGTSQPGDHDDDHEAVIIALETCVDALRGLVLPLDEEAPSSPEAESVARAARDAIRAAVEHDEAWHVHVPSQRASSVVTALQSMGHLPRPKSDWELFIENTPARVPEWRRQLVWRVEYLLRRLREPSDN